ncbi:MAG: hypothetical protein AB7V13_19340 [Pseudorhodoplanes sp.]|uniref:hypothetical protein n=1 Tax=Pseudorhodoplanes sp. TaxID=1934341 RepID=UPI003D139DC9
MFSVEDGLSTGVTVASGWTAAGAAGAGALSGEVASAGALVADGAGGVVTPPGVVETGGTGAGVDGGAGWACANAAEPNASESNDTVTAASDLERRVMSRVLRAAFWDALHVGAACVATPRTSS